MVGRTFAPSTIILFGMLRAVPAIVLGGVYLWMARFIDGNGGRFVDWIGAASIAGFFGLGAVGIVGRAFRRARAAAEGPEPAGGTPPPPMPEAPDFDADAAIRRYLAAKEAGDASAGPEATPPRPTFGKKGT